MSNQDLTLLSGLSLAYVGDASYEIYIRKHLIQQGQTRPHELHRKATYYVSAKAQAFLIQEMLNEHLLTEEEEKIYKRGRNAKSHTIAKHADVKTYRMSTGFEAVMGYLDVLEKKERLETLIAFCIEKVEERNGKKG